MDIVNKLVESGTPWEIVAHVAITSHKAVQKESELAALLQLLADEVKPRTVLEIGSDLGGSLYAWGALPSMERVYAVTLPPPPGYTADYHGASVILGDSHLPETGLRFTELEPKELDFVYIDGDHSFDGCLQDVKLYGLLARRLLVLHDIVLHPQFPDCRVYQVWDELRTYPWPGEPAISEIVHEPRTWGGYGLIRW